MKALRSIGLALFYFLSLEGSAAESQGIVVESTGPFQSIETDKELQLKFSDKVIVTSSSWRITCDALQMTITKANAETGGTNKPKWFLFEGDVRIKQGDREAACERAEILPGDDKITLTGNPVIIDRSLPGMWTGDVLVWEPKSGKVSGTNPKFSVEISDLPSLVK